MANTMLFSDTIECRRQHNNEQTDHTRLGEMIAQRNDKYESNNCLHGDDRVVRPGALLGHLMVVLLENLTHFGRQLRAVAECAGNFQ